jgi:DNA polymerase V
MPLNSQVKRSVLIAIQMIGEALSGRWRMRQQMKSPSYTTNWEELLTIAV